MTCAPCSKRAPSVNARGSSIPTQRPSSGLVRRATSTERKSSWTLTEASCCARELLEPSWSRVPRICWNGLGLACPGTSLGGKPQRVIFCRQSTPNNSKPYRPSNGGKKTRGGDSAGAMSAVSRALQTLAGARSGSGWAAKTDLWRWLGGTGGHLHPSDGVVPTARKRRRNESHPRPFSVNPSGEAPTWGTRGHFMSALELSPEPSIAVWRPCVLRESLPRVQPDSNRHLCFLGNLRMVQKVKRASLYVFCKDRSP